MGSKANTSHDAMLDVLRRYGFNDLSDLGSMRPREAQKALGELAPHVPQELWTMIIVQAPSLADHVNRVRVTH